MHALYQWDTHRTKADESPCQDGTKALAHTLRGGNKHVRYWIAPLIYIATLATHLCGGSAGREGTALQMGGGLAATLTHRFHEPQARRWLIACGMVACFAAVFGTPLAAAFFCYELARKESPHWCSLPLYCIVAYIADAFAHYSFGISHTDFHSLQPSSHASWRSPRWWIACLILALSCAMAANLFQASVEKTKTILQKKVRSPWARPFVGACALIVLLFAIGTDDYLGLGIDPRHPGGVSITSSFHAQGATWWSWLAKLIFTAITLGSGFKGGEVTPLFFIGASLGNLIATLTHAPLSDFAAAGMVAVFAAASRCPIACILMGCELFGWQQAPFLILVCGIAFRFSRKKSIYDRD